MANKREQIEATMRQGKVLNLKLNACTKLLLGLQEAGHQSTQSLHY